MTEICSLCGQKSNLLESHIIPKFIGKWIKKTSATGFLAKADKASERVQDLIAIRLLCNNCEEKFSKLETYFANEIFYPFHEKKVKSFEYDHQLELFAVSLSWRVIKMSYDDLQSESSHVISLIDKAEAYWKEFLLGQTKTISPYENHLLILDYVENGVDIPSKFNWYTLRSVDATLATNGKRIFVYVKFPWMIFVTSVYPTNMEGWNGTAITTSGKITTPQSCKDGVFGRFLLDRALLSQTSSQGPSPEKSEERLLKAVTKDPKKFLESETLEIMIAEKDLERKQNMKDMPKSVIALVEDVILKALNNPDMDKAENQMRKWSSRRIADALASLSKEEAINLDNIITTTIDNAKLLQDDAKLMLKTNPVWVIFMVHPKATKEYQRQKITEEIEKLKKVCIDEKIPLVAFSMNPNDEGVSFEYGFLTDS